MTYSYDLRTKALDYIENGGSQAKASQIFGVTTRTLLNWINRKKDGILPPSKRQRDPYKIEDEKLKSYIQEHPDSFLREISEAFKVSIAAVFYACKRLKITLKKRQHSTKKEMNQKEKSFKKS